MNADKVVIIYRPKQTINNGLPAPCMTVEVYTQSPVKFIEGKQVEVEGFRQPLPYSSVQIETVELPDPVEVQIPVAV